MPTKIIRTTSIILLAGLLAGCARSTCAIAFRSAVRQGPSAGLALNGALKLSAAESGALRGALVREDGSSLPVTGQVDGQAIHLALEGGEGNVLFGAGALQHNFSACRGAGGGTLVGPQPGDSGDWFMTLTRGEQADTGASNLVYSLACLVILLLAGLILMLTRRVKALPPVQTAPWVTASSKTVEPEAWTGEAQKPAAQFLTTYMRGDNRYDVSFSIDAGGDFWGECGAAISHATQTGKNKHVKAIEVWMFDKEDVRTATAVLMSEYAFGDEALRARLSRKGPVTVIRPGAEVTLETKTLRLRARVIEVNYAPGSEAIAPRSVLEQATLQLGVWRKTR